MPDRALEHKVAIVTGGGSGIVEASAKLLAQRLNAATTYLVDLKRQFEGQGNHFGMVGEVLETLIHQQSEEFTSGPEAEADPRL